MSYAKFALPLITAITFTAACSQLASAPKPDPESIAENRSYAASLFRQNCAVCHGPEAHGQTLDDGKVIPSLRSGQFKFKSEAEVYKQISQGGNGMLPFRDQLTDREIRLLVDFVRKDLRHAE